MKEKMNTQAPASGETLSDTQTACARAEELISYLYKELSATEAQDFERHLPGCLTCRTDLAEFGEVRESIADWRAEALGSLPFASPANEPALAPSFAPNAAAAFAAQSGTASNRPRAALAALREFFRLSPDWMRAATAIAGLAFCALAVIALAHLFERPQPQTASNEKPSADKLYTAREVDNLLAKVRRESEAAKPQEAQTAPEQRRQEAAMAISSPANSAATNSLARDVAPRRDSRKGATLPSPSPAKPELARRDFNRISTRERQQLAEVLLPQDNRDEERLPRLSDLLDNDSN